MSNWSDYLREIDNHISNSQGYHLFRGVKDSSKHKLLPSLFRSKRKDNAENKIFCDFCTYSAPLLAAKNLTDIEILFEMRHAGIPTRLLDWTQSFAIALYFALQEESINPCIWVLDPHELNKKSIGEDIVLDYKDIEMDEFKEKIFYKNSKDNKTKLIKYPVAVLPSMKSPRILAQKGHFTIHGTIEKPLEELFPECVKSFPISSALRSEAELFLKYSNVDEYIVYPDLDGLARHLKKENNLNW